MGRGNLGAAGLKFDRLRYGAARTAVARGRIRRREMRVEGA